MATHGVLHVIVDDLRPELGAYGLPDRSTPNIDALAAAGVVFDRAFAQIAVCGPSRNSFMTGRRPDRSQSWNFINHFREDHPEWTTLPGLFLRAGGVALGVGKTLHPMLPPAYDSNQSWSESALPYSNSCWNTADLPEAVTACEDKAQSFPCDGGLPCMPCPIDIINQLDKWARLPGQNVSVANEFCELDAYEDTVTINQAVDYLRGDDVARAVADGRPWYLAVGLHKPHMPWQAAPEDWAKHPLASIDMPAHQQPAVDMPALAYHYSDGFDGHTDPWHPLPADDMRAARRAYRAAVSGMDRKLGSLLDELSRLGLAASTAVCLHSDHGWHLGEGGAWRKFTNYELATRVPLIIRAPWLGGGGGDGDARRSDSLVELVDVLPTIAALAGVPLPPNEAFDGVSMLPLLGHALGPQPPVVEVADVDMGRTSVGSAFNCGGPRCEGSTKAAAFSQYPRRVTDASRPWHGNSIIHHNRSTFTHMGYSARTTGWRYTEWVAWDGAALAPVWDAVAARELYDHRGEATYPTNFDVGELENVASLLEYESTVEMLSRLVRAQFGNVTGTFIASGMRGGRKSGNG